MSAIDWSTLLDTPPFPATGFAGLADRIAALLGTRNDVLLVQGEAIIALEATAHSLARPGLEALNMVTSPYGAWFGQWLGRGGATVHDLVAEPGQPIRIEAVKQALDAHPGIKLVALVHAESASGILNPLPEIARLAKARGALIVVDAVASVGGHALEVDALGIDIAVIGPQKALGGSAGLSALSVSAAAWEAIGRDGAPVNSILSLLDHKTLWLDKGRGALPGMPSALEFYALDAALERIEAEGLEAVIARHAIAARATQAGLHILGITPWAEGADASALVTGAKLPEHIRASDVLAAAAPFNAGLSAGVGDIAERLVRLNHTGPRANQAMVLASLAALGQALHALGAHTDIATALDAVAEIYAEQVR